jgi:hypothetical protein
MIHFYWLHREMLSHKERKREEGGKEGRREGRREGSK